MAHTLRGHDRLIIDDWPEIWIQPMEIILCYDGHHSGKLFCFGRINAENVGMGVRATERLGV